MRGRGWPRCTGSLVNPFSQRELGARIRAVLRRAQPDHSPSIIRLGSLLVDTAARQISAATAPIALTPLEYALLAFLAASPGQTFSPQQLLEHVSHPGSPQSADSDTGWIRDHDMTGRT